MRKTKVRDLHSAADLGQSSPCSGLSFPTNRPGLTVSIAALAPFGWPFPELEGTPSSSRSPFLRPGLRGRPQKSITAAARYRRARLAGGVDARRIVAARGRPFGNAPWGCSARPSRTGTGGSYLYSHVPGLRLLVCLAAQPKRAKGREGGFAATPSSLCQCRPSPRPGAPFWGPRSLPAGRGGHHRLGHTEARLPRAHDRGRRRSLAAPAPAAALPVQAAATPNPDPLDLLSPRGGRSDHDVKGAGQTVLKGNLPGGGDQLWPLRMPRAASGVA